MTGAEAQVAASSAAKAVTSALEGDALGAVGHALDTALVLMPAEELFKALTDADVRRAKQIKAIADAAKFSIIGASGL